MGVTITKDKVPAVLKSLQDMVSRDLLIGIPMTDPSRKEAAAVVTEQANGKQTRDPITNAQIGYIQETGSPANNLPARPFLVPGVAAVQDKVVTRLKKGAKDAIDGDATAAGKALVAAGLMAQNSVRSTINAGVNPPLAASTLAARRRRGRTGTVPLIDTGQLRNSITYVLRKK